MALQTINIGASANDGSGDPLRTAMDKINDNFLAVSRNVFNVKDPAYGAVGNGATDDSAAFQAVLTAIGVAGGGILYMPKGDYVVNEQLDMPDVPFAIKGEGMDFSRIIYSDGAPGDNAFFYRSSGAALIEGAELSDFSIIGPWGGPDHDDEDEMEDGGHHLFLLGKIDHLKIHRVGCDYSKNFSIGLRRCHHYEIKDCRIRWSARDGISTGTCCHGKILDNTIEHCGDDGIACHDADGFLPVTQTTIISGNKLFDTFGINCLGAMKLQITNNSLDLCGAHGIAVGYVSDEGNVGALSVLIADNVITDMVNRNGIDGVLNALAYINVAPQTASAGNALTVAPGDNNTGDGTIQSPYPYFYSQGDDVNAERTGGYDIVIENNTCVRTRNVGDVWSNFGFGETFSKNGWEDPTLTDAELVEGTGIQLGKSGGSHMRNVSVRGNTVRGVDSCVGMSGTYYENVDIKDNKLIDFKDGYGVVITATGSHTIEISENLFDGDPFLAAANRHASTKGAWQNAVSPCAINNGSADGVSILRNRIRNCSTVTNGAGQKYERDNLIFCDFAVAGYNASNLGVGNLPSPGEQYWYAYQISDPTSASYGNVSNFCQKEATAKPSSGKYFLGMFVWARGIAPSTSGFMLGWKRLTTGTGHVLGTDWAEIATAVVDYTNARIGMGVAPSVTAHFKKDDTNTFAMVRVETANTGDASLAWVLTSTKFWVMGIDNSDSDKLKIGDGDNGFTDPVMVFVSSDNQVEVPGYLNVTGEAITGAGALTLGKTFHSLSNSSGSTYAVTLAAPSASQNGVVKTIEMIAGDGTNTVTLALTNVAGGSAATTATFDAAGETLVLVARSAKWVVLKELGVTLT